MKNILKTERKLPQKNGLTSLNSQTRLAVGNHAMMTVPKSNKKINKMTCKLFFIALTAFVSLTVFGQEQISVTQLDLTKLPKGIKYEGEIKSAVRWFDSLGDNVVILTETGIYKSNKFKYENDGSDAELFAYHFIVKNDSASLAWRVYDFISDCSESIKASFIKNTFQVTDLDGNGVAEVWLMYKTVCHGDVSPCNMKIIMYQENQKFAMRGENKVRVGTDDEGNYLYYGGEYKFDYAFANGPKEFLEFARRLWDKNIMETGD